MVYTIPQTAVSLTIFSTDDVHKNKTLCCNRHTYVSLITHRPIKRLDHGRSQRGPRTPPPNPGDLTEVECTIGSAM